MKSTRVLAIVAAVVVAMGLLAGPAQAADGARHKKNVKVRVSAVADPQGGKDIAFSVAHGRAGIARALVVIEGKRHGKWTKIRGSAERTNAAGVGAYPLHRCIDTHGLSNPPLRLHFAGTRKYASANSHAFRLPTC